MNKPADNGGKRGGNLSPLDPNSVVGRKLKSFYDAIEAEPLPDQLLDLLEQLDQAERNAKLPG